MKADQIEYREIPGFTGYRVGSDGTVWSCLKKRAIPGRHGGTESYCSEQWRQLKTQISNGYPYLLLRRQGKAYGRHVHRLVLTAFCGPCPDGCEACHNDGTRLNNNLSNLRWDTRKANCADQVTHGVIRRGELNGKARMTKDDVLFIRKHFADGTMTEAELAKLFGVHRKTINCIKRRETWWYV